MTRRQRPDDGRPADEDALYRVQKALADAIIAGGLGLSDEKLARRLNMPVDEVQRHIQELVDRGWVVQTEIVVPDLPEN